MDFGGGALAVVNALVVTFVTILGGVTLVALLVSAFFGFFSRRAIAWTPLILVLILPFWPSPFFWNQSPIVFGLVLAVVSGLWFWWCWPHPVQPTQAPGGRKRWSPAVALGASVGTFLTLCFLPLLSLFAINAAWVDALKSDTGNKKSPVTRAKPTVIQAPSGADLDAIFGTTADHNGLTWTVQRAIEENGTRYILVGADDQSDAYRGDAPPSAILPVLAFRPSDAPRPARVDPSRWSQGEIELTKAIQGSSLTSLALANEWVRLDVGAGWRMASFHQAAGWRFWAKGNLDVGPQRFWVYIRDQPANPWNAVE